jgi:hypothetical protein
MPMQRLVLDPSTAMVDHRTDSDPPPLVLHRYSDNVAAVSQAQDAYQGTDDLSRGIDWTSGWRRGSEASTSVSRWRQGQITSDALMVFRQVTLEELEEVRVMHQLNQALEDEALSRADEQE